MSKSPDIDVHTSSSGKQNGAGRTHTLNVSDVPGESITVAVGLLMEEVSERSTFEQRPLSDTIDPDGLDRLFEPSGGDPSDITVAFTHGDYRIRIEDGERVELVELV
ncbi:Uncharacterized protein AArcCO_1231 [Halalkaliarchaeum sp. AArc-CO]|uniref:HalOD1 output domain-containing protein n=1 Tax=Halalkaliarchaeum sp. AArc-CO TaxID=2866381 RepID=UPI00217F17DA|nr:HalOD1 output domain-containing protein [Halalkaliarchaeum sp. AArc-CO]UWG50541.1 Uncharacterized protein AArcCO_1231 [Halalkaliarchaeum sp. AArc-CO]